MGNKATNHQPTETSQSQLNSAMNTLFKESNDNTNHLQVIYESILLLNHNLNINPSVSQSPGGLKINPVWMKITHHKNYQEVMRKLLGLFGEKVKTVVCRKIAATVSRENYRLCAAIANFIVTYSDQNMLRTVNLMSIRNDIHPSTSELLKLYPEQVEQKVFSKLAVEEVETVLKNLRVSLIAMINMRSNVLSRSEYTLDIIQRLQQACFVLYCCLLFTQKQGQLHRARTQHITSNITIGAYFLAMGCNYRRSSIFQLAVVFMSGLLESNQQALKKDRKALPSHIFTHLPLVNSNSMIVYIGCNLLHSLVYVRQNSSAYMKFLFNRIQAIKLAQMVLKYSKVQNAQIEYYLEELALQVRPGQIERAYLAEIVNFYVKQHQSASKILNKFALCKQVRYSVHYARQLLKISTIDVMTELDSQRYDLVKEVPLVCSKFIVEVIMCQKVICYYDEKLIWCEIMPKLLENRAEGKEKDQGEEDSEGNGEPQAKAKGKIGKRESKAEGSELNNSQEKDKHCFSEQKNDEGIDKRLALPKTLMQSVVLINGGTLSSDREIGNL